MALTTVLADSRPTALLAQTAPLPVRTSAARLALRPILHPVLARPLHGRGSLPLRPLLRHLLSLTLRVLDFAILVEGHSHVRPPDRRLHRHEDRAPRTACSSTSSTNRARVCEEVGIDSSQIANLRSDARGFAAPPRAFAHRPSSPRLDPRVAHTHPARFLVGRIPPARRPRLRRRARRLHPRVQDGRRPLLVQI